MRTLLIANRGEIAARIQHTARRLGLGTVAVYSDADEGAPWVRQADRAVRLGAAPASASYLNSQAILRACALTGADAVHPGYGFLSENADFAQQVLDAGLTFIGPTPAAIRAMGLKREAKAIAASRGVPLVPGREGGDQSTAQLRAQALDLGLPIILKPSAGGGGKGMHIVRTEPELEPAIDAGRREATSAFGDATLIIEKYLEAPRHVEVQVLGDHHGHLVHLYERDCSIQRRHQKIIEETPSTALSGPLRESLCHAALEVARAISYTNAGTVEFLLDGEGHFYFSEMNTRLQVEHRVTERLLGLDLVELQLRVARDEPLPFTQGDLAPIGHAIECRVYAEDPAHDFRPSMGTLLDVRWPEQDITIDTGVTTGSEVTAYYDPMLAKVISWGANRTEATQKLELALESTSLLGVTTNLPLLRALLAHSAWARGEVHTHLLQQLKLTTGQNPQEQTLEAVGVTLAQHLRRRAQSDTLRSIPSGYRNNRFSDQFSEFEGFGRVEYRALGDDAFLVKVAGEQGVWKARALDDVEVSLETPTGLRETLRVVEQAARVWVHWRGGTSSWAEVPRFPDASRSALKGGLIAPMPGKVVKVLVKSGDRVTQGQALVVLEAMKMEQTTSSPVAGEVAQVLVREGEQVTAGRVLVVLADAT